MSPLHPRGKKRTLVGLSLFWFTMYACAILRCFEVPLFFTLWCRGVNSLDIVMCFGSRLIYNFGEGDHHVLVCSLLYLHWTRTPSVLESWDRPVFLFLHIWCEVSCTCFSVSPPPSHWASLSINRSSHLSLNIHSNASRNQSIQKTKPILSSFFFLLFCVLYLTKCSVILKIGSLPCPLVSKSQYQTP